MKATLQARPTLPAPAKATAHAVLEKEVGLAEMDVVALPTLAVYASRESLIIPATSPDESIKRRFSNSAATMGPWHLADRGLKRSMWKST